MELRIPDGARTIIDKLTDAGFEAYIVGGCVRDMLLGREPGDWDITTSATPVQVKEIFRRTVDTGIEHGTVTVLIQGGSYEVTTYRMDGKYEDHRHPSEVIFTPSLEEDLKRRDFTINAFAYNDESGIIDLFGGQKDLEKKIIRCVGDPGERFTEDALRMLRAIRFAGQLLFDIEKETLDAIKKLAPTIVNISAERIRTEINKLLLSAGSDRLRLAYETGLSSFFLPEFDAMMECEQNNPHHCYSVGEHTLRVIEGVHGLMERDDPQRIETPEPEMYAAHTFEFSDKEKTALVFAALLHDVAKPVCITTDENGVDHFYGHDKKGEQMANDIMRRLKFDNDTRKLVCTLVRYHDARYDSCLPATEADGADGAGSSQGDEKKHPYDTASETDAGKDQKNNALGKRFMRRLMNRAGRDVMPALFILQRADIMSQSEYKREKKLRVLDAGIRCYREVCEDEDAIDIKDLAVTGRDLMDEKGYKSGPEIGRELKRLLELVLDDPALNTREKLLALTKEP